jgi:putative ribosome biogenesis GTPase RsgA
VNLTGDQVRAWRNKRITLLGMSGVGKTRLASKLDSEQWYHFSGDYRIGTHYLVNPPS